MPTVDDLMQLLKGQDPGGDPRGQPTPRPLVNDAGIDFARPFVANAVGDVAGLGGTALGGPVGGLAANNAGYAATDALMQQLKSKAPSFGESLTEGEKNAVINAVGGKIMKGLFKGAKGIVSAVSDSSVPDAQSILNFKPTASQALESYGWHKLATLPKFAEDIVGPVSGAKDRSGVAGFTQALRLANGLNGRMLNINSDPVELATRLKGELANALEPMESEPLALKSNSKSFQANEAKQYQVGNEAASIFNGGQNPFAPVDSVIGDVDKLGKVLSATQFSGQAGQNVRKDLQAYQFMKMVNDSATRDPTGQVTRLDPNKLNKAWTDPDMNKSFDVLYGKPDQGGARDNITQFLKNVTTTQSNGKRISYSNGGFLIPAAAAGLGHMLDIPGGYAGGLTAFYLPTAAMGSLLSRQDTGKIVANLAAGIPLSEGNKLSSKLVMNALQGTSLALMGSDGKKTWGSVVRGPDGSLTFKEQ